tara:strand:- start:7075 stop:7251 length:177 start_codon:yes stop_codon:yes gene_type:complete
MIGVIYFKPRHAKATLSFVGIGSLSVNHCGFGRSPSSVGKTDFFANTLPYNLLSGKEG